MKAYFEGDIGRFYETPDGNFPSVTTVLKAASDNTFLAEWRARVGDAEADRISKESTDIGSYMHYLYECHYQKEDPRPAVTPEEKIAKMMFRASVAGMDAKIAEMVAMEEAVWSKKFRVAGRFDMLAVDHEDRLVLVDFKTTKKDKQRRDIENYRLQLAFYRVMIKETLNLDVDYMMVYMVNREGFAKTFRFMPEETERSELVAARKAFFDTYSM